MGSKNRIRFYLHKEFRAAEISFYLHKDFRAAGIRFYLHKEFLKKNHEKAMLFSKNFRAARANLFRVSVKFLKKDQEKLMIYFSMGAMRLKMMIFKEGNSVCRVAFFYFGDVRGGDVI